MERLGEEVIRSKQNRAVVEACKLSERKHREEQRKFRFDGIKLLKEALEKEVPIDSVFLSEPKAEEICSALRSVYGNAIFGHLGSIKVVSEEVFGKISEEKSPEGVITIAKYIDKFENFATIYNSADFIKAEKAPIVLLESVRDPSNLGAIIRSAAAFGIETLLISRDCADLYHPKTVRASMGMLFTQPIFRVESLPSVIEKLQQSGRRVFAAALSERAKPLGAFPLRSGDCVVIGNEGHGISAAVLQQCDSEVMIPMQPTAESLNASVAAAVFMWEFCRPAGS